MSLRIPVILVLLTAALATVPSVAASDSGPVGEACRTVADNPWAPQPIDCDRYDGILAPLPTAEEACRAVADNPWAPQPIGCRPLGIA